MNRLTLVLVASGVAAALAFTAACASQARTQAVSLPHEESTLDPDRSVTWGRLENGMIYAIMANQEPKDRVSMRLLITAGSLDETGPQRGLAHYLEHLAFNGSTHFPPGTLVERLQRLGMGFGNDTNAHTSFDETVYKLDLPDTRPETITTGLTVMADYATGLLLAPAEVEKERGVILAEMRDRDTPSYRRWQASSAARYPGLIIPERMPIGTAATVGAATPELLRAFYDAWYRPERMVLAVVGAIDKGKVETELKARFAPFTARARVQAGIPRGTLAEKPLAVAYHRDPQAEGTVVAINRTRPDPIPVDSVEERRRDLARTLGENIVARRFQDLIAAAPDGPLIGADVGGDRWLDLWHADLDAQVRPGRALDAIPILEQELRRFLRFGPTVTEMDALRADILARLDEAVAKAATRPNAALAGQLVSSVKKRRVFTAPAQDRERLVPILKALTAEEVRTAVAASWTGGHLLVMVSGTEDLGADAEVRIRRAYETSLAAPVKAPVCKAVGLWGYGADWQPAEGPAPALKDATGAREQAIGVVRRQAGNVTVLVKRTDFKADEVQVRLRLDLAPEPRPVGVAELVGQSFLAAGLKKHAVQEMRDIFAGSTVALHGPGIDDDGVVFSARCRPQELEACLQRLRAYLLEPGWRTDAEAAAKSAWIEQLTTIASDLDQRVSRAFQQHLVGDAAWRRSATLDEARALDFAAARTWLEPLLRSAPLTLVVVGDVQPEDTCTLAHRYLALPARAAAASADDPAAVTLAATTPWLPKRIELEVPGTVARSLLLIAWPTDDYYDVQRTRRLGMLAQAFTELLRQRVREKLGEAYSPHAFHQASETWKGQGFLGVEVGVAPDKAETARAAVLAIAEDLATTGIDEALLAQIKPPVMTSIATIRRQNAYWADRVLLHAGSQPFRMAWATTMEDDYKAITAAELNGLAKRYLVNERTVQVVGTCKGK